MRSAEIFLHEQHAGRLVEDENGYTFLYDPSYLTAGGRPAISLTLPLQTEAFISPVLFPFFDGLIPEGWLRDVARENWKLDSRDRMGLLMTCCRDCIGAVSVRSIEGADQ